MCGEGTTGYVTEVDKRVCGRGETGCAVEGTIGCVVEEITGYVVEGDNRAFGREKYMYSPVHLHGASQLL